MGFRPQEQKRSARPWPQGEEGNEIDMGLEQTCCLSEAGLEVALLEAILELSPETRRKLLMFLHQADDPERVVAEVRAEPDERLELRLTYQNH